VKSSHTRNDETRAAQPATNHSAERRDESRRVRNQPQDTRTQDARGGSGPPPRRRWRARSGAALSAGSHCRTPTTDRRRRARAANRRAGARHIRASSRDGAGTRTASTAGRASARDGDTHVSGSPSSARTRVTTTATTPRLFCPTARCFNT
jgi:hypothetical protein